MREYICIYDEDEMQFIPSPYADTEELIRCKECKYWQFFDQVKANVCKRRYDMHYWQSHEDDFCSRAERKKK